MILRTTSGFFCPLSTNILKVDFHQVGLFFKQNFTSAKVKGPILWKWVLCAVVRTTSDLTQQHDQLNTS